MFYFAWVDKTDNVFGPEFYREDEDVFSIDIVHAEGDFPALTCTIINPKVGLLGPGRKQWVWLSHLDESTGVVTPLFFGRILGVPKSMVGDIVELVFIARPSDYEEQREELAESLMVLPYFDPVFLATDVAKDPDAVLEGYSSMWHIDRVTHQLTTSDILNDESTTPLVVGDSTDVFYDSLEVSHNQSPASRVVVNAKVEWAQSAAGSIDITKRLLSAFKAVTPPGVATITGMERTTQGLINVICGEDLLEKWPNKGDSVGSGWSIGNTRLDIVGGYPLPPVLQDRSVLSALANGSWNDSYQGRIAESVFSNVPGLSVNVLDMEDSSTTVSPVGNSNPVRVGKMKVLWIPIYRMAATMWMDYNISRNRSESIAFALSADVQPLLSDPSDEETIYLDLGTASVDVPILGQVPIESVRHNRYFDSDRGVQSFEHLLCRARAALLYRSRAVNVSFAMPMSRGMGLSCKHSMTLIDDRLPGGQATGKITQYRLTFDGNSGAGVTTVTLGCAVGRGGTPVVSEGVPTYADLYVDGYQHRTDEVIIPSTGDVSYQSYEGYEIEDDGKDLPGLDVSSALLSLTVTGGLEREMAESQDLNNDITPRFGTGVEVMGAIKSASTTLRIEMLPLAGGPFDSILEVAVDPLHIPKMIDLEVS